MKTVSKAIVESLAEYGVTHAWGVVGDALNPLTDAIREEPSMEWVGVRHEEAAAFAAGAQAQLTGRLGLCMGTVGPGSIHLLNGLYDAKKSHAPVLAICGQVPTSEIGSSFFQEVNNDLLFSDVAVFAQTVTSADQMPQLLEQAVNAAISNRGVAVLTVPGNVGGMKLEKNVRPAKFTPQAAQAAAPLRQIDEAAQVLQDAQKVTLLVGMGAREARAEILELAERLQAPMVLTLKAKESLESENNYQVGQTGLIGNPAAAAALDEADVVFMIGTDFPYRDWYPSGKTVIQLDMRAEHIGRRTQVSHAMVGHVEPSLKQLLPKLPAGRADKHLASIRKQYERWLERQGRITDPDRDRGLVGKVRSLVENPEEFIRPEAVAAQLDQKAARDAIFTVDTGMSTVWLSRFIEMRGERRLLGSFNLGSMANAMPQALGAQALDRSRQVIANCGDGGLMMLLGDLRTAVTYKLPVKFIVYNNGRLGMVKLEQEQGGLEEFGTELDNPDLSQVARAMGINSQLVTKPEDIAASIDAALASDGPYLLDIRTNPQEISLPPKTTASDAWGFAIAKSKEAIESP
ncbi:thiamine pyrophosphate-binding protein [Arthrobacter sp. YC-RL1]|uniref:thiamine pyrophosphate-dependent enzyme n=1 Tax=Micrococcaceae TaxID=1268 RepID=UPI00063DBA0E|nr:thiamine pyrophosphate-dependent enzyme [Arthrobacter sp. YC-RL1]ALQ29662.1 thiamine pyrophosphate-binding protein [Arthrobacter sp. YC-RL1]KLI88977.1 thiamine pyrophosphate-binding protein [Arthrobacter sp. YC-RL1]